MGHKFHKFGRVHHGHHNYAFRGYVLSPAVEEKRANFLRSNTFYVMQNFGLSQGPEPLTQAPGISQFKRSASRDHNHKFIFSPPIV